MDRNSWWHASGETVSFTDTTITLWLADLDEILTTPIVPEMPEWLFQKDMGFTCDIPLYCIQDESLKNVRWQNFQIMPFQDLSEEELRDKFNEMFRSTSVNPD